MFILMFQIGKLSVQDKAGTRGVAEELLHGKTGSLNFSKNHDAFLAAQSFTVVSSIMNDGQVWVTPIFGKGGDITALSESQILIAPASIPEHDVLHSGIQLPGMPLSMLGIDLMKRNHHHINGATTISECDATGLHFQVWDYSPNCPKYINRREIIPSAMPMNEAAIREERTILTESDRVFVQSIDTL